MTDLIVVSLEAWDDVWRRNQHLVAGLLADDPDLRVLFVEPPSDPLHDLASRRRPQLGHRSRSVPGQARLLTFQPVKWLPRRVDRQADARLARRIMRAARRAGMPNPMLWINDPGAAELSSRSGWPTLYDITDDWIAADRSDAERSRLAEHERTLLATAAEVVACSAELVRRKSPGRGGRHPIVLVPNAVDVAAYRRPTTRPVDLPTGPVAVYVGTLHSDRLDVALTAETAAALRTDAALVLVGPNLLPAADAARLRSAGAVLLGARSRVEVIAYLQHADVLVVPHLVNAFTDSLDPIKLYEYQAVGRPVVSTPVAGFRDAEDPAIEVVPTGRFPGAVVASVSRPTVAEPVGSRRSTPDWSERVLALRAVLGRQTRSARARPSNLDP